MSKIHRFYINIHLSFFIAILRILIYLSKFSASTETSCIFFHYLIYFCNIFSITLFCFYIFLYLSILIIFLFFIFHFYIPDYSMRRLSVLLSVIPVLLLLNISNVGYYSNKSLLYSFLFYFYICNFACLYHRRERGREREGGRKKNREK